MKSYRSFKMAVIQSEIKFRLRLECRHSFKNVTNYLYTKFGKHIDHEGH